MMHETLPGVIEIPDTDQSKAQETLDRAKQMHKAKRYELYIDERTRIMVTKKNFNRAYALAYKARMNGLDTNKIRIITNNEE